MSEYWRSTEQISLISCGMRVLQYQTEIVIFVRASTNKKPTPSDKITQQKWTNIWRERRRRRRPKAKIVMFYSPLLVLFITHIFVFSSHGVSFFLLHSLHRSAVRSYFFVFTSFRSVRIIYIDNVRGKKSFRQCWFKNKNARNQKGVLLFCKQKLHLCVIHTHTQTRTHTVQVNVYCHRAALIRNFSNSMRYEMDEWYAFMFLNENANIGAAMKPPNWMRCGWEEAERLLS